MKLHWLLNLAVLWPAAAAQGTYILKQLAEKQSKYTSNAKQNKANTGMVLMMQTEAKLCSTCNQCKLVELDAYVLCFTIDTVIRAC